jgi:hypothetical protein
LINARTVITLPTWRARFPYSYAPGSGWPRHWFSFPSPSTYNDENGKGTGKEGERRKLERWETPGKQETVGEKDAKVLRKINEFKYGEGEDGKKVT